MGVVYCILSSARCEIGVSIIKKRIVEAQCVSTILFCDALCGIQLSLCRGTFCVHFFWGLSQVEDAQNKPINDTGADAEDQNRTGNHE